MSIDPDRAKNGQEVLFSRKANKSAHPHCVESVRIRSFFGPYFPAFSPNVGKYGPEKLRMRTLIP